MATPRTDAILESAWTLEEKLEDMTTLCRELEAAIRNHVGGKEPRRHHPDSLLRLIELADNRTCRHAMNPAFPEPNVKGLPPADEPSNTVES